MQRKPDQNPGQSRRGVTLTELLVVLVIIGILSTIAVPVYINHAERARIATAQAETKEIAMAEDAVGAIHGFYVPLQVLDDVPGRSGQNGVPSNADAIGDYGTNIFAIDFNQSLATFGTGPALDVTSTDPRIRNMLSDWAGPFLNPQRVYDQNTDRFDRNKEDFPLDPWGNPYRFYGPNRLFGSNTRTPPYSTTDFNGVPSSINNRFDRYAIVSWGPDGQEDPITTIDADDIYYTFGITRETNFTFNP